MIPFQVLKSPLGSPAVMGKLSGQSTVEQVTTDANGRAEAILTLGPDSENKHR